MAENGDEELVELVALEMDGDYPAEWAHKTLGELANPDGTYGRTRSEEIEVEGLFLAMDNAMQLVRQEARLMVARDGVRRAASFAIDKQVKTAEDDLPAGADPTAILKRIYRTHPVPIASLMEGFVQTTEAQDVTVWCDLLLKELAQALEAAHKYQDPTGYTHPYSEDQIKEMKRLAMDQTDPFALADYQKIVEREHPEIDGVFREVASLAAVAMMWLTSMAYWSKPEDVKAAVLERREEEKTRREYIESTIQRLRDGARDADDGGFSGGYL